MRLLFITDFTEQFAYRLLRGIQDYASETEPWEVCKMPPSFKRKLGIEGIVDWSVKWKADVVIGTFEPEDDLSLFHDKGIVVMAQDYISKFDNVPNITSDYEKCGAMAADRFLSRGFQNFGFFGYNGVCWSEDRFKGFRKRLEEAGFLDRLYKYDRQQITNLWYWDDSGLTDWLKSLPKPVAIMACDDNQGNILLQSCHFCGLRVPNDVAVIGVDNDEILCNMSAPPLSSINHDIEGGGYEAAAMADKMVHDSSFRGEDIIIRPMNIVSRMSSNVFATKDSAILTALQYINANVDHKIIVSDVMKQVPLSRRLLEQRFRKETGTTLYQYISVLRMERFAQLLLSSGDSIANIAAKLEEPDTKSISRRFMAIKGCTPSEFRKRELRKLGV